LGDIFNIKNKRAAQGRRSGNHCGRHRFLGKFQGTPGSKGPEACFAFYSPKRIVRPAAEIVKLRLGIVGLSLPALIKSRLAALGWMAEALVPTHRANSLTLLVAGLTH
jgi:hypothetical protein